ncbi:hypothetical protein Trydic_g17583 [Trypoxylus dichotomus]
MGSCNQNMADLERIVERSPRDKFPKLIDIRGLHLAAEFLSFRFPKYFSRLPWLRLRLASTFILHLPVKYAGTSAGVDLESKDSVPRIMRCSLLWYEIPCKNPAYRIPMPTRRNPVSCSHKGGRPVHRDISCSSCSRHVHYLVVRDWVMPSSFISYFDGTQNTAQT